MNIDLLIKMANEITSFWEGEAPTHEAAVKEVASHIRRFWEPRMRAQVFTYLEQRHGAGLNETALAAVTQLAAQARQEKATAVAS